MPATRRWCGITSGSIPKVTQCLDAGFLFTGSGKVWIDMDALKYEIADETR